MAADNTGEEQQTTKRGRPFAKGQSGNPAGRPAGSRNKTSLLAQELLDGDAEDIVRKVIEKAKEGDATAMRLVMERILPARKEPPATSEGLSITINLGNEDLTA